MKKYDASLTSSEILDQQTSYYLPKSFSSVVGTKHTKMLKDIVQNPKNNTQTAIQTNSSLCSLGIEAENKYMNELGALSLAVNYCLKSQSKIADTLCEIGQYLKAWNEDSNNANTQSSFKQKQNPFSPSTTTIFTTNRTLSKQAESVPKKISLQSILVKIEALQSEISLKMRDFDSRFKSPELQTKNKPTSVNLQLEDTACGAKARVSYQKQRASPPAINQNVANTSQKKINALQASNQERPSSLPSEFQQKRRETVPDETLNFSRQNYDMQSTENSQIANLNFSICGVEIAKKQKSFTQRKNATSKLQLGFYDNKSTSTQVSNLMSSEKENKYQNTVAVKLDLQTNNKSIQGNLSKQTSQKKTVKEKKVPQKNYLRLTPRIKIRESASLERQYKTNNKRNIFSARRGTTAIVSAAKEVGFSSLKVSPRELNLDFGIRKNSTKPGLNIVPQKEVIDDGAPDHTADHTMRKDDSILSVGENPFPTNEFCRSLNLDTERVYDTEGTDDLTQNPTHSFVKNTAKKEKLIIKTLMGDNYGGETSLYLKGKINYKKLKIFRNFFIKQIMGRYIKRSV